MASPRANLPHTRRRKLAFCGQHSQLFTGLVRAVLEAAMSFGIYLFGIVLLIGGLVYAAAILHLPVQWIIVTALVLLGAGVVAAVKATRQRDPAK
jgi:hypothetical protein